jgi:FkbM family methyltransferase
MNHCRHKEDEILDRLCGYRSTGFYIDVGANSPTIDSVTLHFYNKGWRGINIEPLQEHINDYLVLRPEDINLCMACGEGEGVIDIYVEDFLTKGLSTAKQEYASENWAPRKVPVTTLTKVFTDHAADKVVDFLKIDVEGSETNVIKGMDWQKFTPLVVCVESVKPNTTIDMSAEWEPILIDNGYTLAATNLFNKFYVKNK